MAASNSAGSPAGTHVNFGAREQSEPVIACSSRRYWRSHSAPRWLVPALEPKIASLPFSEIAVNTTLEARLQRRLFFFSSFDDQTSVLCDFDDTTFLPPQPTQGRRQLHSLSWPAAVHSFHHDPYAALTCSPQSHLQVCDSHLCRARNQWGNR